MSIVVCEWGPEGARQFGESAGAMVIVDVLSFSTCVDIAVNRGATVYPFADDCRAAARMAKAIGAELAGPRGSREHRFSLSPSSLLEIEAGTKLLLPSPNGSAISVATRAVPVLAGCLRNARGRQKGGRNRSRLTRGDHSGRRTLAGRQPSAGNRRPDRSGRDHRGTRISLLARGRDCKAGLPQRATRNGRPFARLHIRP